VKLNILAILLAFFISLITGPAFATNYKFVDLGVASLYDSYATAINSSGQVVGYSYTAQRNVHATLWNGTTATDLGTLGGKNSYAAAINDLGQVAGYSDTARAKIPHATLWNGTTATDLTTTSPLAWSEATAINSSGQVAGYAFTPFVGTQATLWNGNVSTDLGMGYSGGVESHATAINSSGQVVGYSYTSDYTFKRATFWNGTAATDLGALGGLGSSANAINSSGQVVGYSYSYPNEMTSIDKVATLWSNGNIIDLNSLLDDSTASAGWVLTNATGINDNGWIVGNARNYLLGVNNHAFALQAVAVPEAETYTLLTAGLCLMSFVSRRKKT
jgi:probable HAF family extracellular repeat protein